MARRMKWLINSFLLVVVVSAGLSPRQEASINREPWCVDTSKYIDAPAIYRGVLVLESSYLAIFRGGGGE